MFNFIVDEPFPLMLMQIRFIADPSLSFTNALDLNFDGALVFGGDRSKRYALVVEDGKVTKAYVEPDNTGLDVSAAEKVLG
jgi:2-Cys peroxiredoxin 5